jgi:D-alanyl-D-alanine carboxypeptidase
MVAFAAHAEPTLPEKVQTTLQTSLAERAPIEKVTGVAAYVSLGDPGPAIEAFAGTVGRAPFDGPVSRDTLFHTGSTSKSFTAAVILRLEAAGKLSLDDTIGEVAVAVSRLAGCQHPTPAQCDKRDPDLL